MTANEDKPLSDPNPHLVDELVRMTDAHRQTVIRFLKDRPIRGRVGWRLEAALNDLGLATLEEKAGMRANDAG